MAVRSGDYPAPLQIAGASFVTLTNDGKLRGCIGTLEACRALVCDIALNAFNAAFRDPRFPPLTADELVNLQVHISILKPATPVACESEADLIRQLRPGIDGLILQDGAQRATFLPSVWESLPDAESFVRHLKLKAGMSANHWSPTMQAFRYPCESFGGRFLQTAADRSD